MWNRHAVMAAILGGALVSAALFPGCVDGPAATTSADADHGTLQLALSCDCLPGESPFETLDLLITRADSGEVVADRVFQVGGKVSFNASLVLPTGKLLVHGWGWDAFGGLVAQGGAPANIQVGKANKLALVLQRQGDGEDAGTLQIQTVLNDPPELSGLAMEPAFPLPGEPIKVSGSASDEGAGTIDILVHALGMVGVEPIQVAVGAGQPWEVWVDAPELPGADTLRIRAVDAKGGEAVVDMPFIVCDPDEWLDSPGVAAAVDTVFQQINEELFAQPAGPSVSAGWMMDLPSGDQVDRSVLDFQVEPLIAYGFDTFDPTLKWLYAESDAVRYAAAHLIREVGGFDVYLPNFDVPGTLDESGALDDFFLPGGEGDEPTGPGDEVVEEKKKKCCVESFVVKWTENAGATATHAKLRLDYAATFGTKDPCDPACCEFRQNVMTTATITDGPGKGWSVDTSPMHDDNYSRADDTDGDPAMGGAGFTSNDNPGIRGLDASDVLDYSFTAEQMIIDTCNGNAEVAKRGPHTGTITGKDPRVAGGVPKTLE